MPNCNKLIIALTGGIGSGKSSVATFFSSLGIEVINADQIARDLTDIGQPCYQAIKEHFGTSILNSHEAIDRKKLQHIIFKNNAEKKWLENLLHPLIWETMQKLSANANSPYVILEIPLLFETEKPDFIANSVHRTLVVDTSIENQIERVQKRDHLSSEKIQTILKHQASREYRLAHADDVIVNEGNLDNLKEEVWKCHELYLTLCGGD